MFMTKFSERSSGTPRTRLPSPAWLIVVMSAIVLFCNNGFALIGITAFDSELINQFGISVGALKIRDAFTFGTVAVTGPLAGYLLDRVGIRPLMVVGMLLMAAGMIAYSFANGIIAIYGIHILFGLCLVTSGLFANVILVAATTRKHRGLAIGFIIAGSSLGQAVAPGINEYLGSLVGWRQALLMNAALPILLIPFILFIFPRLDGKSIGAQQESGAGPSYREALSHRNFWLLAVIAMIGFCVELGVVTNMVLFAKRELRLDAASASAAVFCLFVTALISQIGAGWLADRVGSRVVHASSLVVMTLGTLCLAMATPGWMWIGVFLFGLGWGGNYSLIQLLTSNLFLGQAIGRIMGTIAVIESIGAALGPVAIGGLYDHFGSYSVPFFIAAGLTGATTIAVLMLQIPPRVAHQPVLVPTPA